MLSIDEAIALVKIERECVIRADVCDRKCEKCDLLQDSAELIDMYEHLAEWLEELKAYRQYIDLTEIPEQYKLGFQDGIIAGNNKAIDEAICKVEEHKTKGYVTGITNNPFEFGACQMADDIVKILEQLKAGDGE